MPLRLVRRILSRGLRNRVVSAAQEQRSKNQPVAQVVAKPRTPEWVEALTRSLKENALAPSEEVILHAFDLYCDELNAPFVERRHAMNGHLSNIVAGFAKVQALAPDMVERAAAKHKLELHRFIDKKDDL